MPEFIERTGAFLLFSVASPVIVAAAAATAFLSRRSPFIAHLRVGKGGEPFWVWKLRTMWEETSSDPPGVWSFVELIVAEPVDDSKSAEDPRVRNRFASFCRRHSIDELPQLLHVVRGEMSLVGPRPLTRSEIVRHYRDDADELLSVKPGLTGSWQTGGRSAVRFPERVAMDLEMIRSLTWKRYLSILLKTIPALIHGKGAW